MVIKFVKDGDGMNELQGLTPIEKERLLRGRLLDARKSRDREVQKEVERLLVQLYVRQGEYFKMSDRPDPRIAEENFKKALQLQRDNPIAHYRLAHVFYRKEAYGQAASHFEKALTGSITEALNDTQRQLTYMLLVNCGILMAKEALKELEEEDANLYVERDVNDSLIDKYRRELLVNSERALARSYYRLITEEGERIISDHYADEMDGTGEVLLYKGEEGKFLVFSNERYQLSPTQFTVMYYFIKSKSGLTLEGINQQLEHQLDEVRGDAFRRALSQFRNSIPYWQSFVEESRLDRDQAGDQRGRIIIKKMPLIRYSILVQASEILPDD
ncbi:tetratricopeptide repeat protein [Virgibacillus sp. W0181]|uniref:tetratricopeptide repeat protein n=1 Tax=Virgibacillus sp. W0181 TaxID=3391581 RepID=UPI003F47AE45